MQQELPVSLRYQNPKVGQFDGSYWFVKVPKIKGKATWWE